MHLQRKKHPKYRKKKTDEEKKMLKRAIKLKDQQLLDGMLWSLPLDLKKVIFRLAIVTNMMEWSLDHQKKFRGTIMFLDVNSLKEVDKKGNRIIRTYDIPEHSSIRKISASGNQNQILR